MIHGGTRRTATATPFVHEGPRRDTENCRTATPFVHEGPRRDTKNCNCNTFCPRRATEDHGELQLQHLLSTKGHGGTRRTATATPFVHEGPRRDTENCRTATPFVHEGPRRDTENCNCNTFCPRRDAEGHGELQLQHLLSTKGRGGTRRTATATPFVHEEPRRDTENCRTATPFVHEEPRRDTENCRTATPFVHEGMRGTTKKNFFCPRWAAKNSFLIHEGL